MTINQINYNCVKIRPILQFITFRKIFYDIFLPMTWTLQVNVLYACIWLPSYESTHILFRSTILKDISPGSKLIWIVKAYYTIEWILKKIISKANFSKLWEQRRFTIIKFIQIYLGCGINQNSHSWFIQNGIEKITS